ncbi:MAG TPA: HAMP domain-containing sensor histidine kinase [Bacilli bacterium]
MKIQYKLWLTFTSLFIIMGLALYLFIVNAYEKRAIAGQAGVMGSQGAAVVEKINGTYPKFPDRTMGYLQFYSKQLDARLFLLDEKNEVVFDTSGQVSQGTSLNLSILAKVKGQPVSEFIKTGPFGYVQYTMLPLHQIVNGKIPDSNNSAHGYLLVVKDINVVYEDIHSFQRWMLGLMFAAVVLFFIVCFPVASWFTKPIADLIDNLRKISPHKRSFAMKYKRKDEIRKLVDAITEMVGQLNHYEQRQRQFLSASSHELKTPLATIQLIVENLKFVQHDDRLFKEFTGDLSGQIDKMKQMVDQLLDIHRVWDKPIERDWVSLDEAEKHIKDHFLLLAEHKEIRLVFQTDSGAVFVDRDLFFRGLDNLVSNAVRYSPEGSEVIISFKMKGKELVQCSVCDRGIGISKEDLLNVLEPFYRAKDATEWNQEGTGLGLTIVKQMVDIHGGTMEIKSLPGKGTCVFLYLSNKNDTKGLLS